MAFTSLRKTKPLRRLAPSIPSKVASKFLERLLFLKVKRQQYGTPEDMAAAILKTRIVEGSIVPLTADRIRTLEADPLGAPLMDAVQYINFLGYHVAYIRPSHMREPEKAPRYKSIDGELNLRAAIKGETRLMKMELWMEDEYGKPTKKFRLSFGKTTPDCGEFFRIITSLM